MSEKSWSLALLVTKAFVYLLVLLATTVGLVVTCVTAGALVGVAAHMPVLGVLASVSTYLGLQGGLDIQRQKIFELLFPREEEGKE